MSIGASSFSKNDSVSTIIDRSDKALYQAKRTGKNRVVGEEAIESDQSGLAKGDRAAKRRKMHKK